MGTSPQVVEHQLVADRGRWRTPPQDHTSGAGDFGSVRKRIPGGRGRRLV